MFGQCKAITRTTSNQHTNNIITNILVRAHYEQKRSETNTLQEQESEVFKLAQALPAKVNTVIPLEWSEHSSVHYQAHLERISDYLLHGPGVWWQHVEKGVEFFDIESRNPHIHIQTPQPQHFRSSSLGDVDVYLLSKWEQCLDEMVQLPAQNVRTYQTNGACSITSLTSCSTSASSESAESQRTHVPLTPCTSTASSESAESHVPLTPCTSTASSESAESQRTHVPLTPCTSTASSESAESQRTHVPLTPCTSTASSESAESQRTHVPLTPCTSTASSESAESQRTHVPLTPCTSSASGESDESRCTHVPLTPCTSSASGESDESRCTHVPLTHTSSASGKSAESQCTCTHVTPTPCTNSASGESAQTRATSLSLTPCTSRTFDQRAKACRPLSLTPYTSRPVKHTSEPTPRSSLSKSILQVMPLSMLEKVQMFDQLRSKVKSAKASNTLCYNTLKQYERASNNLKEDLLNQFKKNSQVILERKNSTHIAQVQHKNNILKKILAHEWNTTV